MSRGMGEKGERLEAWVQQIAVPLAVAMLTSSGLWALVSKRADKNNAERKMLVGLAHDRIIHLGMVYVTRGYITQDEYENLNDYLYQPYEKMGGNGSAKRVMEEVRKLPIKREA